MEKEKVINIEKDKELLKANENNFKKKILELNQRIEKFQTLKVKTDSGNRTESFECGICATIFLAEHELREHKKLHHCESATMSPKPLLNMSTL